ncbi:ABC transporter substrate-binding protein [Agrobacterium vitis]|uniref:Extracellular solute-binding protein n=1 Tax=Agrobacterium vitis TaxID=373 RepID=A0A7K1R8Z7_AGRVI|nr:extracellular solute-binding protein [Agrobacterium vitis]MVA54598.1 extracellular solute-binding protein [Agrobacterium vitis]
MMTTSFTAIAGEASRCARLTLAAFTIALASSGSVLAAPKGDLVILQWMAGSDLEVIQNLEKAFMAKYPDVKIKEVPVTWSGDPRGGLRTSLMGGEKADLMINTWPAFRTELVTAGLLRPLDDAYSAMKWGERLDNSWKDLGSVSGQLYGVTFTYGDRSGLWYDTGTFKKAGIATPPKDWAQFLDVIAKLKSAGVVPMAVPAKTWAHAEVFETLILREGGADLSRKLVAHEIPWTDDRVKAALRKWRELLSAGCCGDASTMLGTEWDNASDRVLKERKAGFFQMGMWINNRAETVYKLAPDQFGLFQFPATGQGHDTAASVDAKEFVALASGGNSEAADAFMDFTISREGANIIAKGGLASSSKAVDVGLYSPAIQASNTFVTGADTAFVLGDGLPGDLADEYRIQLQKFLGDPSDANIDRVTAAIEAKAKGSY